MTGEFEDLPDSFEGLAELIAVFAAMEQEIRDLKSELSLKREPPTGRFSLYAGRRGAKKVLVALTGMGKEKAVQCATKVFDTFPVEAAISTGFGGGLSEALEPGDVVVCGSLHCQGANTPLGASPVLLATAKSIPFEGCRVVISSGVSVSELCATPDRKRDLGLASGADAVDMESYWIATLAAGRGLPFVTIRSIFDPVDSDVSLLNRLSADGRVSWWRTVSYIVAHPACVRTLRNYSRQAALARRGLALCVARLIEAA